MLVQPYGAILIGSFAGILSTLGFEHVQGARNKKIISPAINYVK